MRWVPSAGAAAGESDGSMALADAGWGRMGTTRVTAAGAVVLLRSKHCTSRVVRLAIHKYPRCTSKDVFRRAYRPLNFRPMPAESHSPGTLAHPAKHEAS